MEAREVKMGIYAKIQQVMQTVHGVEKSETNPHGRYKFAGHEAVTAALRDKFAELGIVRHASATSCEVLEDGTVKLMVRVTYIDVDDGSRIELDMPAIQPPQGRPTAQQVGQAVSYAVKTTEMKLFALTGDPEPDSDAGHRGDDGPPPPSRSDRWTHPGATNGHPPQQDGDHFAHLGGGADEPLPMSFKSAKEILTAINNAPDMTELALINNAMHKDFGKMSEKSQSTLMARMKERRQELERERAAA